MSYRIMTLGQIAPAAAAKSEFLESGDQVWLLNLDQIEPHTGCLLSKQIVNCEEVGNSTNWFDETNVLYSKLRPYLNKVYLPDDKGLCTTELVPLKPNPEFITRDYLAHYLRSDKFLQWVNEQIDGAKMPRVSMKIFWNHEINLPPLEEQKRIAAILDKADSLRRKRAQAITLADNFLRATFLKNYTESTTRHQQYKMLDLAEPVKNSFVNGPFGSDLLTSELTDIGVPVVYIRDIRNGVYRRVSTVYVTTEKAGNLAFCNVKPNDVLIAKVGDPPGTAAMYPADGEPAIVTQDVIRIRCNQKICHPEYLMALINSSHGNKLLKPIIVEATRSRIGLGDLKKLDVLIPPIDDQLYFVSIQNKVNKIIKLLGESLEEKQANTSALTSILFKK